MKRFGEFILREQLVIDWDKVESYWDNLSSSEKYSILDSDDFADPDTYKDSTHKELPSPIQNNLLRHLPRFEKDERN